MRVAVINHKNIFISHLGDNLHLNTDGTNLLCQNIAYFIDYLIDAVFQNHY